MNYLAIFSLLFVCSFKIFCSEKPFILQLPAQQIMGVTPYPIPEYYVPKKTLPVVEKTVYYRIDRAIIDLHENGFEPSSEALEKTAEIIANQVSRKRLVGVYGLMFGAGTIIVAVPSPLRQSHPEIHLGGAILAACGIAILCDSMIECCCWKHKMASTKSLIRKNHTKVD